MLRRMYASHYDILPLLLLPLSNGICANKALLDVLAVTDIQT